MKIIIIMFILAIPAFAEKTITADIPGFLEVEMKYKNFTPTSQDFFDFNSVIIGLKYGTELKYADIYGFWNYENNFQTKSILSHKPFRDTYEIGFGFMFLKTFYIDFSHICSHRVVSNDIEEEQKQFFYNMTHYTHNVITIGCKLRFD